MTPISNAHLLPHADLAIQHGLVEAEELEAISTAYQAFLDELEKEWPPERIKEHLLEKKRVQYQKAARYIQQLELSNRDARVKGVSYKVRQATHKKIEVGHRVLAIYKAEGLAMKHQTFGGVRDYIQPADMRFIQEGGFQKHLEYAVFGYPQNA